MNSKTFKRLFSSEVSEIKENEELECDWVYLEPRIYFKRQSSYYFSDASLILLNYIIYKPTLNMSYDLFITLKNDKKKETMLEIKIEKSKYLPIIGDIYNGLYSYYNLRAEFVIKKYLVKYNWKIEDVNINVEIMNKETKGSLSQPIQLKIKSIQPSEPKLNKSIVCSKCVLPNEKGLNDLRWWFRLNSQMGHDFIDICNPLGEESILNQIKSEYGEFARIRHLNCFPNLISKEHVSQIIFKTYDEYINSYEASKIEMFRRMDLLNELIINECYLDHFDKYRYIAQFDQDEIILNHYQSSQITIYQNNTLSADNFLVKEREINRSSNLFDYMAYINRRYSRDFGSVYFLTGWYVNNSVIASFCSSICDLNLLAESSPHNFSSSPYIQKNNKFGFDFQIRSISELNYLKFVCRINEQLLSNFTSINKVKLKLKDFFRFFYLLIDSGGKTVSDTNRIFTIRTHSPSEAYIANSSSINGSDIINKTNVTFVWDILIRGFDYGASHLSHFRENLVYFTKTPIYPSHIGFDLNYLDLINSAY